MTVGIGQDPRDIVAVKVVKIEAKLQQALFLCRIPCCHSAIVRSIQLAVITEAIEQLSGVLQHTAPNLIVTQ